MLGSALDGTMARGLIGHNIEIAKVREPGAVRAKVTDVISTGPPTNTKPLLLKVTAQKPNGLYDYEASFVAIWPGSQIDVLA